MSMIGEFSFFPGLQVNHTSARIFIKQTKYLKEMLKWSRMEECDVLSTPMIIGCKLSKDDESPKLYKTLYRSMIVSLLYLIASRPEIMQAVGMVARFQLSPKEFDMQARKRIFRYLKCTLDFGLWYPKRKNLL